MRVMRLYAAMFVLFGASPALAAGGNPAVTAEIFNQFDAREQRIIYAITADPEVDRQFGADMTRVIQAHGSGDKYELAKQKFQMQWLERIKTFSDKYRGGNAELTGRMAKIPKQNLEALKQRERANAAAGQTNNVAWFIDYDDEKWKGKLLPALWSKINDPHLLEYNIAGMRSMDAAQKAELFEKLAPAESWLSAESTADEIIKESKKEFNADLGKAQAAYASRAQTVKEQLAKLEAALKPALLAGSGKTAEELAAELQKGYDGPGAEKDSGGTPVDTRTSKIAPGKIVASNKEEGALGPAKGSGDAAAGEGTLTTQEPPAPVFSLRDTAISPKTDKEYGKAAPPSESRIGAALKSPKIAGIGGGVLGAVLGFFLGGPVGAVIGAAAGAALGAGLSSLLNK